MMMVEFKIIIESCLVQSNHLTDMRILMHTDRMDRIIGPPISSTQFSSTAALQVAASTIRIMKPLIITLCRIYWRAIAVHCISFIDYREVILKVIFPYDCWCRNPPSEQTRKHMGWFTNAMCIHQRTWIMTASGQILPLELLLPYMQGRRMGAFFCFYLKLSTQSLFCRCELLFAPSFVRPTESPLRIHRKFRQGGDEWLPEVIAASYETPGGKAGKCVALCLSGCRFWLSDRTTPTLLFGPAGPSLWFSSVICLGVCVHVCGCCVQRLVEILLSPIVERTVQ